MIKLDISKKPKKLMTRLMRGPKGVPPLQQGSYSIVGICQNFLGMGILVIPFLQPLIKSSSLV